MRSRLPPVFSCCSPRSSWPLVGGGEHTVASVVSGIALAIVAGGIITRRRMTSGTGTRRVDPMAISAVRDTASPTIVLAPDGRLRFANKTAADLLGYEASALATTSLRELVSQVDSAAILDLANGQPGAIAKLDCRLRMADGAWLSVELEIANLAADPTVHGLVVSIHDVTRWRALEDSLTQLAFHDSLTRLPNRALFIDRLEHALGRRRRHARGTAVLFVDLDDFKTVNDALGHVEADAVLAMVAERLLGSIRPEDTAGRLGGDEFAILLDDVDEEDASLVAARVLSAARSPVRPARAGDSPRRQHRDRPQLGRPDAFD